MGAEKKHMSRHAVLMAASPARRRSARNRRAKERRVAALSPLAAISAASLTEVVSTVEPALPPAEMLEETIAPDLSACMGETTSDQVASRTERVLPLDGAPEVEDVADDSPCRAVSSPAVLENSQDAETDLPRPQLRRGRTWPCEKRVVFDTEISVHSITPYAEIYGLHPRFFDFDKGFSMVPAQGFGAARIASSEELTARQLGCGFQGDDDDVSTEDDSSDDDLIDDICEYTLGADGDARIQEECCVIAN